MTNTPDANQIDIDPVVAHEHKASRVRQLQVRTMPSLRIGGYALVLGLLAAHNTFVLPPFDLSEFLAVSFVLMAYSLVSWAILHRFFPMFPDWRLGDVFLTLDIVLFTLVVYASGADQS